MRLKKVAQLQEEWFEYLILIEAYLDLREKSDTHLVPYASLLNHMHRNNRISAAELSLLAKDANRNKKLFEIDSSTDRKLCKFLGDQRIFVDCPICMELLNVDLEEVRA